MPFESTGVVNSTRCVGITKPISRQVKIRTICFKLTPGVVSEREGEEVWCLKAVLRTNSNTPLRKTLRMVRGNGHDSRQCSVHAPRCITGGGSIKFEESKSHPECHAHPIASARDGSQGYRPKPALKMVAFA